MKHKIYIFYIFHVTKDIKKYNKLKRETTCQGKMKLRGILSISNNNANNLNVKYLCHKSYSYNLKLAEYSHVMIWALVQALGLRLVANIMGYPKLESSQPSITTRSIRLYLSWLLTRSFICSAYFSSYKFELIYSLNRLLKNFVKNIFCLICYI